MENNYFRFIRQYYPNIKIDYEPERFMFPHTRGNIGAYVPDFRLRLGKWTWYIETKGYMDSSSLEKFRLMKRYYPYIKIYLVGQRAYNIIRKSYASKVRGWE